MSLTQTKKKCKETIGKSIKIIIPFIKFHEFYAWTDRQTNKVNSLYEWGYKHTKFVNKNKYLFYFMTYI